MNNLFAKMLLSSAATALMFVGMGDSAQAGTITNLHNTGLGANGTADPYYTVTDANNVLGGNTASYVFDTDTNGPTAFPKPAWHDQLAGSKWTTPNNPGGIINHKVPSPDTAGNTYTFTTQFNYTADSGTQSILGLWQSDNYLSQIRLLDSAKNLIAVVAGPYPASYAPNDGVGNFSITSGFVSGVNYLEFVVVNGRLNFGNPVGLDVSMTVQGPAGPQTAVPEPSSLALLGLGGIGLAIGAYRRRRASAV